MRQSGRSAATAEQFVESLAKDPGGVDLSPADRAMLAYALQLTRAPHTVTTESISALRAAGFDDGGIHDIAAVTAYYAFVNRTADGLGVELEERFRESAPDGDGEDHGVARR